ncbi:MULTISPECIES: phage GP46 family protein [unclassified Bradyrhizobium]|uniref:phage GP46 family protein n=1 Tax=unclassified Bradyrhizobium TaxID=2631580 RepID=UPI002916222F|nr:MULTISPECIES: phage GP46 family protein [unclassified Bradyrhizobium]
MANDVVIRAAEGCAAETNLLWDSVWDARRGVADWALAGADEPNNRGGLRAQSPIETAVILALFTDKRIEPDHPLFFLADGDARGYWGDGIALDDDHPGSWLWLLERAPLTILGLPASQWAEQFALEALAPLKDQGVCVRIDVTATQYPIDGRLELAAALYGRDGALVYNRKFDVLWNKAAR